MIHYLNRAEGRIVYGCPASCWRDGDTSSVVPDRVDCPACRKFLGEQPMPTEGKQDVYTKVLEFLAVRRKKGIETYGRPLQTHNGRNPLRDMLEETADQLNYNMQIVLELQDIEPALKLASEGLIEKAKQYDRLREVDTGMNLANVADKASEFWNAAGTIDRLRDWINQI